MKLTKKTPLPHKIEAKHNGEGGDENLNIKLIWPKRQ
jgi:hypothetical protein